MKKKDKNSSGKETSRIKEPSKEPKVKLPAKSNTEPMGFHGADNEKNLNPEE